MKWLQSAKLSSALRKRYGYSIAAVVAIGVVSVLFSIPSVAALELRLADFWTDHGNGKHVTPSVAVAGVDEEFLRVHTWPLEKDLYGDLIEYLVSNGAAAVAFDYVFAENLDACGKGDSLFIAEVQANDSVVVLGFSGYTHTGESPAAAAPSVLSIPARFSVGEGIIPNAESMGSVLPYTELLQRTRRIGFFNMAPPLADGMTRRAMLLMSQDSKVYPSMALTAAGVRCGDSTPVWDRKKGVLQIGNRNVPVDHSACLYVNFKDSIPVYALTDLYASMLSWFKGEKTAIGEAQLRDRVIFIGNTALTLGDFGVTPLSRKEVSGRSPNVLVHARTASTILDGTGIRFHDRPGALFSSVVVVLLILLFFLFLQTGWAFALTLVVLAGVYCASQVLYGYFHFVPVVQVLCAGLLQTGLFGFILFFEKDLDRRRIYGMFKAYISPDVIDDMRRKEIRPQLGGQQVEATAFFTDIENFSSFSEHMTPVQLVGYLNEYFSTMTNVLLQCHGTLDKFIGDAIVAFFGAPRPSREHALEACTAAVRMQEALALLRTRWQSDPEKPEALRNLRMRIGINTGLFVTGNIGCDIRMNYTMIGDAVNLAARLESACKKYGVYTVVGEETFTGVKDHFLFRKLDVIQVKGRQNHSAIYQLMGIPRQDDTSSRALIAAYEQGLAAYLEGEFGWAMELFLLSRMMERHAADINPSAVMYERCKDLMVHPPQQWEGVYRMEQK